MNAYRRHKKIERHPTEWGKSVSRFTDTMPKKASVRQVYVVG